MLNREKWRGPAPDAAFHRKFEETLGQIEKMPEPGRKRRYIKTAGAIVGTAAACGAVFFGVCAANPVWASNLPVIGSIFKSQEEKLPYKGNYETYVKPAAEEEEPLTASSSGITITLLEAYCSSEALYLSCTMESETSFEETREEDWGPALIFEGQADYSFQSETDGVFVYPAGEYTDDCTYEGVIRLPLPGEGPVSGEDIQVNLKISQVIGYLKNPDTIDTGYTTEELESMPEEQWSEIIDRISAEGGWDTFPNTHEHWFKEGSWEFQLQVSPDDTKVQKAEIHEVNEQGVGLESVTVMPFEISVKEAFEDNADAGNYFSVLLDAEDTMIRMAEINGSSDSLPIYGHDISTVTVYICDYIEYMEEIKGREDEPGFKDLLEEKAKYKKELHFENYS